MSPRTNIKHASLNISFDKNTIRTQYYVNVSSTLANRVIDSIGKVQSHAHCAWCPATWYHLASCYHVIRYYLYLFGYRIIVSCITVAYISRPYLVRAISHLFRHYLVCKSTVRQISLALRSEFSWHEGPKSRCLLCEFDPSHPSGVAFPVYSLSGRPPPHPASCSPCSSPPLSFPAPQGSDRSLDR